MIDPDTLPAAEDAPAVEPAEPAEPAEAATADPAREPQQPDEALSDAGRRALERERAARREAERAAREAAARVAELERAAAVREVAARHRLTDAQAALLAGETAEEIDAHAQRLLEAFGPAPRSDVGEIRRRPVERLLSGTVPSVDPSPTPAEMAARLVAER